MSLWFTLAACAGNVANFLLNLDDNAFTSIETVNGNTTTGTLTVNTDGSIAWTGDVGGSSESGHTWWSPVGSPIGTWHVKLTYDGTVTNQYSTGSGLASWVAVSTVPAWNFLKTTDGTGGGSTVGNYTIAFSNDAGSTTFDSVSFSITLQEDSI